jgi:hypothetical protein
LDEHNLRADDIQSDALTYAIMTPNKVNPSLDEFNNGIIHPFITYLGIDAPTKESRIIDSKAEWQDWTTWQLTVRQVEELQAIDNLLPISYTTNINSCQIDVNQITSSQIDSIHLSSSHIDINQSGAVKTATNQIGLTQIAIKDFGVIKINLPQIDTTQVSITQNNTSKISLPIFVTPKEFVEINNSNRIVFNSPIRHDSVAQQSIFPVNTAQVSSNKIGISQIGLRQNCISEIGVSQISTAQVSSHQVNVNQPEFDVIRLATSIYW